MIEHNANRHNSFTFIYINSNIYDSKFHTKNKENKNQRTYETKSNIYIYIKIQKIEQSKKKKTKNSIIKKYNKQTTKNLKKVYEKTKQLIYKKTKQLKNMYTTTCILIRTKGTSLVQHIE